MMDVPCVPCSKKLGFTVRKLKVTFNLSKAPRGTPPVQEACPSCDRIWEDIHSPSLRLDPLNGHVAVAVAVAGGGGRGGGGEGQGQGRSWIDHNPPNSYQNHHQNNSLNNIQNSYLSNQQNQNQNQSTARSYSLPETSDYSAAATGVNIKKIGKGNSKDLGKGNSNVNVDVRGAFNNVSQDENAPTCVCGGRAITKTTTKEGPNKGRPFYTCPKPR